jgi:hypothetical protein
MSLAGCDDSAEPQKETILAEEAETSEAAVLPSAQELASEESTSAPRGSARGANAEPEAKNVVQSVPASTQPSRALTDDTQASPESVVIPTPAPDPHAGHDMSNMSDEDMKEMGHD